MCLSKLHHISWPIQDLIPRFKRRQSEAGSIESYETNTTALSNLMNRLSFESAGRISMEVKYRLSILFSEFCKA